MLLESGVAVIETASKFDCALLKRLKEKQENRAIGLKKEAIGIEAIFGYN
jgi:hypothetical protein